jgi:hypothetical protein
MHGAGVLKRYVIADLHLQTAFLIEESSYVLQIVLLRPA